MAQAALLPSQLWAYMEGEAAARQPRSRALGLVPAPWVGAYAPPGATALAKPYGLEGSCTRLGNLSKFNQRAGPAL